MKKVDVFPLRLPCCLPDENGVSITLDFYCTLNPFLFRAETNRTFQMYEGAPLYQELWVGMISQWN
jgi:hypothetical protein